MQGRDLTEAQIEKFLLHLAGSGNVSASAEAVGLSRSTFYTLRKDDDEFAAAWADAVETATDALEAEARRRAVDGYDEYVTCKDGLVLGSDGQPVFQKRHSDSLLALLLRAHRPDKFRDRASVEHTGPGGKQLAATINLTINADPRVAEES
jgi:AcrR family transcriptional regulator